MLNFDSCYSIALEILNILREKNGKEPTSTKYLCTYDIVEDIMKEYGVYNSTIKYDSIYSQLLQIKNGVRGVEQISGDIEETTTQYDSETSTAAVDSATVEPLQDISTNEETSNVVVSFNKVDFTNGTLSL